MIRKWPALLLCTVLSVLCCHGAFADPSAFTLRAFDIPDNDALHFTAGMGPGWNLGNSFDAADCTWLSNPLDYESGWCGVKASGKLFDAVSAAGFRTVRLPVSWHNHVDDAYRIDPAWLDRVAEVVDMALSRDLYVILNIHHDTDLRYYYPDTAHYGNSERYISAVWEQLALRFEDRGEKLIFESINEPRLKDTNWEWSPDPKNPVCRDAMDCINRLNQVFVNTVRATGGNNASRYLMVPGYAANPSYACTDLFVLPQDSADNRIIVSVHAYTPYSFALQMPGTAGFSVGAGGQTSEIGSFMNSLYKRYIANGIPVVIGEFGALAKGSNLQARVDYAAYYTASAAVRGIPCCVWDNHAFTGSGELFGLLHRDTCRWEYPEIRDALLYGSAYAGQ